MMHSTNFKELITNTDIYLIDQILKDRYSSGQKILDAGCGGGRNLPWFANNDFELYAIDNNEEQIGFLKEIYPDFAKNIQLAELSNLAFKDAEFDHIICSAVLHFAHSESHFIAMFTELVRVLKYNGSLFIRMTTDEGLSAVIAHLGDGVYQLKDETNRFLITRKLLQNLMIELGLDFLEPFKTTLVEDVRSMATIVLTKR